MIAYKGREVRRPRSAKMARNLDRLYKEGKCRDCSVIVTRMDFAKILGKFTKVKIQYENVSSPKTTKKPTTPTMAPSQHKPNDTFRLRTNENGMVLPRRSAYNKHPINNSQSVSRKPRPSVTVTTTPVTVNTPRQAARNVLKENNGLKIAPVLKDKNSNYNSKSIHCNSKQYAIIFVDPKINNNNDCINKIQLAELLPKINKSILPSVDWCIDYLPKIEQASDDKVYDRIEAELEGLMFSEKNEDKSLKPKSDETKVDEFPSIMDILNDNYTTTDSKQTDPNVIIEFKSNLESSDVEAMLLGKSNDIEKVPEPTPMEVDSTVVTKLIEDVNNSEQVVELSIKENPQSPSILDGNLEKGIEEHIPAVPLKVESPHKDDQKTNGEESNKNSDSNKITPSISMEVEPTLPQVSSGVLNPDSITEIIFRKLADGKCIKTVSCPKNLNYSIQLEGKPVEFLGAPKLISSIDDLQVLLQIVNESELDSLYVLH